MTRKLVNIVGARPQFIKVSPIIRAINDCNSRAPDRKAIDEILIHTGQHYDDNMSEVFFEQLEIKEPDYHLGVGSGPHGNQTAEIIKRTEEILQEVSPDIVMVYGDTNSTLGGSIAASKLDVQLAHVEAGLRSFNRQMPEEVNRVLTDHSSDFLFCPTKEAVDNLNREGFAEIFLEGKPIYSGDLPFPLACEGVQKKVERERKFNSPVVLNVGDVMYDASLQNVELASEKSKILAKHQLKSKKYALATVHRAGNTENKDRLRNIFEALKVIARKNLPVILPLHPRTKESLDDIELDTGAIELISPVSYLDMIQLEDNAKVILTDSGGVQKEAYFYEVPCITLREETEWVNTVEEGLNVLVGADKQSILSAFYKFEFNENIRTGKNFYGKGNAAQLIVNFLFG